MTDICTASVSPRRDVLLVSKQCVRLVSDMSKRKWDQTGEPSEEGPSKVSKTEDGKTASEAAAAAVKRFRTKGSLHDADVGRSQGCNCRKNSSSVLQQGYSTTTTFISTSPATACTFRKA